MGVCASARGCCSFTPHAVWGLALDDFFGPTPGCHRPVTIDRGRVSKPYSFCVWVPSIGLARRTTLRCLILYFSRWGSGNAGDVGLALSRRISFVYGYRRLVGLISSTSCYDVLAIGPRSRNLSLDRLAVRRGGRAVLPPAPMAGRKNLGPALDSGSHVRDLSVRGSRKLQGPSWWSA